MMKLARTLRWITALAFGGFLAIPLSIDAQTPPSARDTLARAKATVDSSLAHDRRLCKTTAGPSYLCRDTVAQKRTSLELATLLAPPAITVGVRPEIDMTRQPGDAELPRVWLNSSLANTPSNGRTLSVTIGGDLQAALDSSRAGDRILLTCGGVWVGNYVLPAKPVTAASWTTIAAACASLTDSEGVRMTPARAAALRLPIIRSISSGPALGTAKGASRWRIAMLELTADASTTVNTWGLISLGEGNETSVADLPSDIVIDRVYLHGRPDLDIRRGVTDNGARIAVIDSWISDIHSSMDSNGIAGWLGPGPHKYVNNTISTAGVSIGSGGADMSIQGVIPSDFEIRRNWMTKDMAWLGKWVIKNNFETKNASHVLIEGNVLDNSPQNAQAGYAFVLWSVDQNGLTPWSTTNHVTIRYNVIRNVAAGWNLSARGYRLTETEPMHHVTIRHNVVIGLDAPAQSGQGQSVGRLFQIHDVIPNLVIEHNTGFSPSNGTLIYGGERPLPGHIIRDNLTGGGQYQIFNGAIGQGAIVWDAEAGPGSDFRGNVIALFSGGNMIAGNWSTNSLADLSLVGGAQAAYSPTATLDELALAPASYWKGKATDGTDPGADIAKVKAATAGVVRP